MFNVLILVAGFAFLLKGSDYMIDGATSMARRMKISDLFIGLTIIAFGTSTPELIINVIASLSGTTDIAIGNVIGSNIANILLALGVTAIVSPLVIKHDMVWKEIPLSILAASLLLIMVNDTHFDNSLFSGVSRLDGMLLIALFGGFLYYVYHMARSSRAEIKHTRPHYRLPIAMLVFLAGIIGLTIGGQLVIVAAKNIAGMIGMSQAFIGLTLVALGTTLPELMISVVAAVKKHADIAIGNVIGSNILNISWALGLSAIIRPIPFAPSYNLDLIVLILVTVLLFLWLTLSKWFRISRRQGVVLVFLYLVYISTIVFRG